MNKVIWLVIIFSLLLGCASTPNQTLSLSELETVSPDKLRIYFIREKEFMGLVGSITGTYHPILIDGKDQYEIPNGSYFFLDVDPGEHEIISESEMDHLPGKFILNINGQPGDTLYVKIEFRSEDINKARFKGGLLGSILSSAVGSPAGSVFGSTVSTIGGSESVRAESEQNDGPYQLTLLMEDDAKELIKELQLTNLGKREM
jgi:hypothetical protein